MYIMKINLFLAAILLLFSCQSKTATEPVPSETWEYVDIRFDNIVLRISNFDNTVKKNTLLNFRETSKGSVTTYTPDIIKERIVKISSNQKDSIYKWSKKLIEYPIQPKRFCTDYAGKLLLNIQINEQVTQSCWYTSICEWSTLSAETTKLNTLFKQILK